MRVFLGILKFVAALLLALILFSVAGDPAGYALFRSVFSRLDYDTALPLSAYTAFAVMLALVFVPYWLWHRSDVQIAHRMPLARRQ